MKKAIIGYGGFAKEVYYSLDQFQRIGLKFFVDDLWYDPKNLDCLPLSEFDPLEYEVVVAVGNPLDRMSIVSRMPENTRYFTHVHPTAQILGDVEIGEGSIICAGVILTTNIKIGKHAHLNLQTTIGHDTQIGNYLTTAPGAKISGNCTIGNYFYLGTNASVREKITITNNVTVGLNSGVVKDIDSEGTYVGVPAKKIK